MGPGNASIHNWDADALPEGFEAGLRAQRIKCGIYAEDHYPGKVLVGGFLQEAQGLAFLPQSNVNLRNVPSRDELGRRGFLEREQNLSGFSFIAGHGMCLDRKSTRLNSS